MLPKIVLGFLILFLALLGIELGPQGVSVINSTGKLDPVGPSNTKLNASLQRRFARIDDLRDALKFRKFARQSYQSLTRIPILAEDPQSRNLSLV